MGFYSCIAWKWKRKGFYYFGIKKVKFNILQNLSNIKDGIDTSDFDSMKNDINESLVNNDYLAENVTVDDEMICQYSGLPSLKSYKKTWFK